MFQSETPDLFFSELASHLSKGTRAMLCVSNHQGCIQWLNSGEVVVDSVEGCSVDFILSNTPSKPYVSPSKSDEELMAEFGISREDDQYLYGSYKYEKLEDAVNYAKAQKSKK